MDEPRSKRAIQYSNARILFGEDAKAAAFGERHSVSANSLALGKELPSRRCFCIFTLYSSGSSDKEFVSW